jgi:twitching motility two-component system response regulator PilG
MQRYDADVYVEQSAAASVESDPIEHELSDQPCDVEGSATGDSEEEIDVDKDQAVLEHVTELETVFDDFLAADAAFESTPADNSESTSAELESSASDDDTEQPIDFEALTENEAADQTIVPDGDQETGLEDPFERESSCENEVPVVDASLEPTPAEISESISDELETSASDDNPEQPIDFEALTENEAADQTIVPDGDQETGLEDPFERESSCENKVPIVDASLESTPAEISESTSDELESSASDTHTSQLCHMETTEDPPTIPEGDTERELPSRDDLKEADESCEETPEAAKIEPSGNDDCTQSKCGSEGPAALDAVGKAAASNEIDEIAEQDDPVREADVVATVSQSSKRSQPDEGPTILVVDDSPTIRTLVSMSLEEAGYTVVTAPDVMEAIKQMTDSIPSLVLTDISMPGTDGYKFCKLIKSHEKTRSIPVIMLSGKDGMFDKIKGKFAGCDDYITKPFQSAELLEKVTSCLPLPVSDSQS